MILSTNTICMRSVILRQRVFLVDKNVNYSLPLPSWEMQRLYCLMNLPRVWTQRHAERHGKLSRMQRKTRSSFLPLITWTRLNSLQIVSLLYPKVAYKLVGLRCSSSVNMAKVSSSRLNLLIQKQNKMKHLLS